MSQLNPYIKFNDNKCKEAMNFYKGIFGGKLDIQTVGESPMAKEMPNGADKIMHATLTVNDKFMFMGSDMMRDKAVVGDNVGVAINCDSEKEIRAYFEKLSVDGDVFMPLEKPFWGGLFAVVTDKYGIEWMLNMPEKTSEKK